MKPDALIFTTLIGAMLASCASRPPYDDDRYQEDLAPSTVRMISEAISPILASQQEEGNWCWQDTVTVPQNVGATAIVCSALLHAAPLDDKNIESAISRGIDFILKHLTTTFTTFRGIDGNYSSEQRIWGYAYALILFCQIDGARRVHNRKEEVKPWVQKIVDCIARDRNYLIHDGWAYSGSGGPSSFNTASVTLALLYAKEQGARVDGDCLKHAAKTLLTLRNENGAYWYNRVQIHIDNPSTVPGSAARSAICELALYLLDKSSQERLERAVDLFHENWETLNQHRKREGTHAGEHGIAPYYFFFGLYYTALATEFIETSKRQALRDNLLKIITKTRDPEGTWNDLPEECARGYATAMVILALLGPNIPRPPELSKA